MAHYCKGMVVIQIDSKMILNNISTAGTGI